jgi:hypothetical protein
LFPSFGGSTRAWNAFPEALGRGARGWRCFGGISRGGVDTPTYYHRNGKGSSILDLTLATPHMAEEITNWAIDDEQATGSDHEVIRFHTPYSNSDPPPAFATTSTETIDFSIGFGFAALIYVSLESVREFYVDFVDIHREIRVFTRFRLPHHAKCRQNIANSAPHAPKPLGTRSKLLWTFRTMEFTFLSMEEMTELMEVMTTLL